MEQSGNRPPIRIVVVDDSPTMRELLVALFQNLDDIQVVGTGANGEDAVRLVSRLSPNLLLMDVSMPKLDGLAATTKIMRETPTPIILLSASMKHSDVDLTFQALQAGALTVLSKPGVDDPGACENILQNVRTMSGVPVIHHWGRKANQLPVQREAKVALPGKLPEIDVIGIAASTGGPGALALVLGQLDDQYPLPVIVVQHISPGFCGGLAEWISTRTRLRVEVAGHGDALQPGVLFIAPDDYHLQVDERGILELNKHAPYKGLRPSANYLFDSLARVFGPRALGVILTGMGDDGCNGLEALHQAGGLTIAQNAESCVVYGMPGEAVSRNLIDYSLSPEKISEVFKQLAQPNQTDDFNKPEKAGAG